jgi:hypothetical protein
VRGEVENVVGEVDRKSKDKRAEAEGVGEEVRQNGGSKAKSKKRWSWLKFTR